MTNKMKIKKGDQVIVIAGRDKGKKGQVQSVIPKENRAIVQGVNVVKKHTKPGAQSQGGIAEIELSIHVSNIALIDAAGNPTRVGFGIDGNGNKSRVAKSTGDLIGSGN